jgi:cytochrome c oxidase subunit 3
VSSIVQVAPPRARLSELPFYQQRGVQCVWCVVITEAMLFACMFAAYYYLGNNKDRWAEETAPSLHYPFILLAILLSSSAILHWGQKQAEVDNFGVARAAVWVTILFGLGFLALQGAEYYSEWATIAPYSDSYGSIFYTITSLHAAHVCVGLLLLIYLGVLPEYGLSKRTPRRPYATVAIYWHFVDAVWVFIVTLLYIIPNIQRLHHAG